MTSPAEIRAALRERPDEVLWPSARIRRQLEDGRLEVERAVYSPDDPACFAVGDHVAIVPPDFSGTSPTMVAAIDLGAGVVTITPVRTAKRGDELVLVRLAEVP